MVSDWEAYFKRGLHDALRNDLPSDLRQRSTVTVFKQLISGTVVEG